MFLLNICEVFWQLSQLYKTFTSSDEKCCGSMQMLSPYLFYSCQPKRFSPPFLLGCLCELFLLTPLWRIFLPWKQGESLVQSKRLFRRLNYRKHLKANKKERKEYIDPREMIRWIQMLLFCSVKMTSLRKPPWSLTSCKGAETTGTHIPGKYRKLFKCLPLGMS